MVDQDIPTPSPVSSPSDSPYSLSERSKSPKSLLKPSNKPTVNISTRPIHTQLNRLILARLPLALPPYTTNPSTYVSGLLHIAPIYITFETLWQTILDAPRLPTTLKPSFNFGIDACDPEHPIIDSKSPINLPATDIPVLLHAPKVCSRTHSLLAHLRLPGLLRAGRLRADIRVLTGTPEHKIDEQLEAVSQDGKLADFIAHTKLSVETNPHVLLAYAWVLYMALFSGGRYLRASLVAAGGSPQDFWNREPSPVRPYSITQNRRSSVSRSSPSSTPSRGRSPSRSHPSYNSDTTTSSLVPGLQFFNFNGAYDGEDIKTEFKTRIAEAEHLLTEGEKEDIVTEAGHIFKFMVGMVEMLDNVMGTSEEDVESVRIASKQPGLVSSRDSVAVAQERLFKSKEAKLEDSRDREGMLGRIVHFTDEIPVLRRVRKSLCGFRHEGECKTTGSTSGVGRWSGEQGVRVSLVAGPLAFLVLFLTWFYTLYLEERPLVA